MEKNLWLAVSADKLELPLYVADTQNELAKVMGVSSNAISSAIARPTDGSMRGFICRKVTVEVDE